MVNEKSKMGNSYVGPLADAENSADMFCSGIIWSTLLEKVLDQQHVVDALLADNSLTDAERFDALQTSKELEEVWIRLAEEIGWEC